jgi:hypothetical protein
MLAPATGSPLRATISPSVVHAVLVYCASSDSAHPDYAHAARALGATLAAAGASVIYGGGQRGSMGALAEGVINAGGHITGVIPRFMMDLEWGHPGVSELLIVDDMHDRKRLMLQRATAVVALPGGSGTFDELLEAISLKRLGSFLGPIVIVNVRGFFDPLVAALERAIDERFMDTRHRAMWSVVDSVDVVLAAIRDAAPWDEDAVRFAAL